VSPVLTVIVALAALIAALVMLDRAVPSTGILQPDAEGSFQRLIWQRRRAAVTRRRRHGRGRLELLPEPLLSSAIRRDLGARTISPDSIIGTIEADKAASFDAAFRPPVRSRQRWERLWIAASRGDWLPPISVFRVGEKHFVIDGHHRVSVFRALGAQSIDAQVIELRAVNRA
jgi:hypothetical protein